MGDREPCDPRRNVILERLLGRAEWSPENLGDHLNRLAASLGLKVHVNRRYPRRWVYAEKDRATPRVPRDPLPSLVCLLLYQRLGEPVTPHALGWPVARGLLYVPADDGLGQSWDGAGAIAALGTRTDHAVVDDLERVADARRRLDDALGGGSLLPATREDLRLVVALLRNSSYTEEVGRRLYAVAAEFSRLAGWLAYDSGQAALAQRYFMAALRAAHSSADRAVGANILGFMSTQAAQSNTPGDAIVLAESALTAEHALTPAVVVSLYGRLALASAYTGDGTACRRSQDRAFDLLSRSVPENEPSWIYWFTQADAQGLAGWSLLTLGQPAEAEPYLRRAVALLDPGFTRDRAGMLCDLAMARISMGAVERACATAGEAATIIRRLDSPRQSSLLVGFRRAAEPYANSVAVREFDAKYCDLTRSTSA